MRGSALSLATFMGPFVPSFATDMVTTWLPVMGPPGVSCRAVLAGAAAQRASVLIAGPLGLCYLPMFLCLGIVAVVAGLAGRCAGAGPDVRADCPPAVSRTGRGPRKGLMGAKGDGGKHDSGTAGPDDIVGGGRGREVDGGVLGCMKLHPT